MSLFKLTDDSNATYFQVIFEYNINSIGLN